MNQIETIVRGFKDHIWPCTISVTTLSKMIGKKRNHLYNLFNNVYVISEEDKNKLNDIFKDYNYGKRIK